MHGWVLFIFGEGGGLLIECEPVRDGVDGERACLSRF